jgi:hypothetical protein
LRGTPRIPYATSRTAGKMIDTETEIAVWADISRNNVSKSMADISGLLSVKIDVLPLERTEAP